MQLLGSSCVVGLFFLINIFDLYVQLLYVVLDEDNINHCHITEICNKLGIRLTSQLRFGLLDAQTLNVTVWNRSDTHVHCWICSSSYFRHVTWLCNESLSLGAVELMSARLTMCLLSQQFRHYSPGARKYSLQSPNVTVCWKSSSAAGLKANYKLGGGY